MDARLIVQVIINIMNNAIQYTQKGSCIILSACRKGEMAEVSIADDGPGIPERCGSTCLICSIRRNRVGRIAGEDLDWD